MSGAHRSAETFGELSRAAHAEATMDENRTQIFRMNAVFLFFSLRPCVSARVIFEGG